MVSTSVIDRSAGKGGLGGFWTLTKKFAILTFILVSIVFAVLIGYMSNIMRTALEERAMANYAAITQMFGETIAPAVRWKKAGKIEEGFAKLTDKEKNTLRGVVVFNDKEGADRFSAALVGSTYDSGKTLKELREFDGQISSEMSVARGVGGVVISLPIAGGKNGAITGGLVALWDTSYINTMVDDKIYDIYVGAIIMGLVLVGIIALTMDRSIGKRIKEGVRVASHIAKGDFSNKININSSDELGQLAHALHGVQESLIAGDESEKRAAEFGRIKQALDCASGSTIIADETNTIVFANQAALQFFSGKAILPERSSGNAGAALLGQSTDVFSSFAGLGSSEIAGLKEERTVVVGNSHFDALVSISPVLDTSGNRLGMVMEWVDRTHEVNAEEQLKNMVNRAASGDFSGRIAADSMSGFYSQVANMLNHLAETTEAGLNETLDVLNALATGDLTANVKGEHSGIFEQLVGSCNVTTATLKDIVSQIREMSVQVSNSATVFASDTEELSQRTEKQASYLEDTAVAMEQMLATVRRNSDSARQASDLVGKTRDYANGSGELVNKAIAAVGVISDSSKLISPIIGVIDDIAFQTNLLALNASVEAARAGEQGRGFAVVASEVRNLAGRSATAAKEIKELIDDSVVKVDEGRKLVEESGQALLTIVKSVADVSEIVTSIASAGQEQLQGIDQINSAIAEIDEMTRSNGEVVKKHATASSSVGGQAERLNALVGFFNDGEKIGSRPRDVLREVA